MGIKLKLILRDQKDHFAATLYKDIRKKLGITKESIILFAVNKKKLIRIPNPDFHISIPKSAIIKNQESVEIDILRIYNKDNARLRKNKLFTNNLVNIDAFVPNKTIFGNEIYVLKENKFSYVWYCIGGGTKFLRIRNQINAEKLAEFLGFYFGDGNTSKTIRSFRLNNCEPSTLIYSLNFLENLGIPHDMIKLQIIYSSNTELTTRIKNRCKSFWSKTLNVNENQVISVNRSKNKRETLRYGSARVLIDNAVLVEVFLNGLLKNFLKIIQSPKTKVDYLICNGFFRGLLAAEGFVSLHKNSLRKVGIAFNPHSDEANLYKTLLKNLGIEWKFIHGNSLIIHKYANFERIFELNGFKFHDKRNEKFLRGFKNHKYCKLKF